MATKPKAILSTHDGREASPITKASNVLFENGQTAQDILNDRQDAMISPVIENPSSMFKVGQGDNVDYSANVVNGAYESMVLKGKSMVNCIQEPSSQDVVLPYEFEDGQYVTINDTKESGALGVELKGQTLVNLYELTETPYQYRSGSAPLRIMSQNLIQGKTYMIILNFSTVNADGKGVINFFPVSVFIDGTSRQESNFNVSSTGVVKIKYTPSKTVEDYALIIGGNNFEGYNPVVIIENAMIIEYVEGMENWDIPYFTGMASCKMPILHTVGKNLFDVKKAIPQVNLTIGENYLEYYRENGNAHARFDVPVSGFEIGKHYKYSANVEFLEVTEEFKFNNSLNGYVTQMNYYPTYNNNTGTSEGYITAKSTTITFGFHNSNINGAIKTRWSNIQIEEVESLTSPKTTYEPYKSSILSLPEEVVLRNIGSVKDTLNLNTGDYIQRIGEVVLDGSEDEKLALHQISSYTTHTRFEFSLRSNNKPLGIVHTELKCDRFTWINGDVETEHIKIDGGNARSIFIYIQNSKLATQDVNGLRVWLSQNPTTIQYQLETPIVTKINLPSTLKSWNATTHIYSEIPENSLYPTLSHSNPTYPVILKPSTKYSIVANSYSNGHTNSPINFNLGGATATTTVGNRVTTITTPSTLSNELLTMSGRGNKLNNVMVIEGDVVGDEPYFEGMCDSKSPILSNVGKNLFDGKFDLTISGTHAWSKNFIKVLPNTTYIFSHQGTESDRQVDRTEYYNEKFELIGYQGIDNSITTPNDCHYIKFRYHLIDQDLSKVENTQLEQGTVATPYEPHKSNILSANGDKIELTEDMFEQGSIYFSSGSTFASMTQNVDSARIRTKNLLSLNPNISYSVSISNDYYFTLSKYNGEQRGHSETGWTQNVIITPTSDMKDFGVVIKKADNRAIATSEFNQSKFQIREVDKTIVLRSLPNGVCDTLNVENGEYVQRISEVILNGSENWMSEPNFIHSTLIEFKMNLGFHIKSNNSIICGGFLPTGRDDIERIYVMKNGVAYVRILKSKVATVDEFKQLLQSKPVTIQYELETPIVKTVDLSGFPFSYENGHVVLSSGSIEQSLTPKVEYSVATNRNGQIRSNQKMVERHQKQLDQLQAIILANLVNSQYNQTLTTLKYELSRV